MCAKTPKKKNRFFPPWDTVQPKSRRHRPSMLAWKRHNERSTKISSSRKFHIFPLAIDRPNLNEPNFPQIQKRRPHTHHQENPKFSSYPPRISHWAENRPNKSKGSISERWAATSKGQCQHATKEFLHENLSKRREISLPLSLSNELFFYHWWSPPPSPLPLYMRLYPQREQGDEWASECILSFCVF